MKKFALAIALVAVAILLAPSFASAQCNQLFQTGGGCYTQQFVQPLAVQSFYAQPIVVQRQFVQAAYAQPLAVQSYGYGFQRQAFVQPFVRQSSFNLNVQRSNFSNFGFARQRGFSLSVFR